MVYLQAELLSMRKAPCMNDLHLNTNTWNNVQQAAILACAPTYHGGCGGTKRHVPRHKLLHL